MSKRPDTGSKPFLGSRFLREHLTWLWAIAGAIGIANMTILALAQGDRLSVALLGLFACMWLVFAVMNARRWKDSLKGWQSSNEGWNETNEYVGDLHKLLGEALQELSTWDREKAEDIGARGQTISLLRLKNMEDRHARRD